eukprot:ANDGO_01583.mRNA.1 hypothetical protein
MSDSTGLLASRDGAAYSGERYVTRRCWTVNITLMCISLTFVVAAGLFQSWAFAQVKVTPSNNVVCSGSEMKMYWGFGTSVAYVDGMQDFQCLAFMCARAIHDDGVYSYSDLKSNYVNEMNLLCGQMDYSNLRDMLDYANGSPGRVAPVLVLLCISITVSLWLSVVARRAGPAANGRHQKMAVASLYGVALLFAITVIVTSLAIVKTDTFNSFRDDMLAVIGGNSQASIETVHIPGFSWWLVFAAALKSLIMAIYASVSLNKLRQPYGTASPQTVVVQPSYPVYTQVYAYNGQQPNTQAYAYNPQPAYGYQQQQPQQQQQPYQANPYAASSSTATQPTKTV